MIILLLLILQLWLLSLQISSKSFQRTDHIYPHVPNSTSFNLDCIYKAYSLVCTRMHSTCLIHAFLTVITHIHFSLWSILIACYNLQSSFFFLAVSYAHKDHAAYLRKLIQNIYCNFFLAQPFKNIGQWSDNLHLFVFLIAGEPFLYNFFIHLDPTCLQNICIHYI